MMKMIYELWLPTGLECFCSSLTLLNVAGSKCLVCVVVLANTVYVNALHSVVDVFSACHSDTDAVGGNTCWNQHFTITVPLHL